MDGVSHAVWGATIVRKPPLVWWAALVGVLPDIISIGYGFIRFRRKYMETLREFSRSDTLDNSYMRVYYLAHSLVPITVITIIIALVRPIWTIVAIPYYLHIIMDVPTHHGIWATRIFYPFSDFHFQGANWWHHRWVNVANWGALIIVNAVIILL